jgi:hypothetical protein
MTRVYYKGAAACMIMFDLSSQQTFNSVIRWKNDLDSKCTLPGGKTIPCILVGNKVRLWREEVDLVKGPKTLDHLSASIFKFLQSNYVSLIGLFQHYYTYNFNLRLWSWNKRNYTKTQGNRRFFFGVQFHSFRASKWSRIFNISKQGYYNSL